MARAAAARPERVAQLVEGVEPHHPLLRQVHLELLVGAPRWSAVVLLLPPPLLLLLLPVQLLLLLLLLLMPPPPQ